MSDPKNETMEIKIPKKSFEELKKNVDVNGCGCGCIIGCVVQVNP